MLNMIGLVFSLPTKKKFNCNENCGKMTKKYAEIFGQVARSHARHQRRQGWAPGTSTHFSKIFEA